MRSRGRRLVMVRVGRELGKMDLGENGGFPSENDR